ncbi:DUF3175 domain-containing protein [Granulicella cerasi]|nr:DUF3175 domain-containing protein [Granulicella cerasi]
MATKKAAKRASGTKTTATKTTAKKSTAKKSTTPPSKRWSAKVTTDSTKPGPGLFKKSAKAISEGLAKKSVSPKGPGQAMQMLSFYENRAGKNLPAERKQTLERAKKLLARKEDKPALKKAAKKTAKKAARKSAKKAVKRTAKKAAKKGTR